MTERDALRGRRVAIGLVLSAAVLWSVGGVGVKSIELPSLSLAGYRCLFALPVLVALLAVRLRSVGEAGLLPLRSVRVWVAAGSYAVMMVAFVVATRLTTAANAVFIQCTSSVYVAFLSWPVLRERVTWRQAVACVAAIGGIVFLFSDSLSKGARLGNAVAVLSSLGATGLPVALRADQRWCLQRDKKAAALVSPLWAIVLGDLLCLAVCTPAMIASPPRVLGQWAAVALLGTVQIGAPYLLYSVAIRSLTALESAILPTVEPILNPIWVLLATGERPGTGALFGAALVLGGILLQAPAPPRRRPSPSASY